MGQPPTPSRQRPAATPPFVPVVTVDVPDTVGGAPLPVVVPARTPEEAFVFLHSIGEGMAAQGARDLYQGTVLQPIRDGYKRTLEGVERQIIQRRAALGARASDAEIRELARWAARERAKTARLWRLPQGPAEMLSLEARDWRQYGVGGRTFENLVERQRVRQNLTGRAAFERMLGTATTSNPEVNAKISRGAKLLRGRGAVLGGFGLALSAADVLQAPPDQRARVAERQAVGMIGGLVASEAAVGLLGVGCALLAATPPGWVVIAVGLVAGAIGAWAIDRYFYPEDHAPVAGRLAAGDAVDPERRYALDSLAMQGLGGRLVVGQTSIPAFIDLTVQRSEDQPDLARRALLAAATSAGLRGEEASEFARRHAAGVRSLDWRTGDPTPQTGPRISAGEFDDVRGERVRFGLTPAQLAELEERAYARQPHR